jgi:hypothetical protein
LDHAHRNDNLKGNKSEDVDTSGFLVVQYSNKHGKDTIVVVLVLVLVGR